MTPDPLTAAALAHRSGFRFTAHAMLVEHFRVSSLCAGPLRAVSCDQSQVSPRQPCFPPAPAGSGRVERRTENLGLGRDF